MKPKGDFLSTAIHEAGHVAACINLGIHFSEVSLKIQKSGEGFVNSVFNSIKERITNDAYTPEQEVESTNFIIMSLAGPVCEVLFQNKKTLLIENYKDLNDALDIIEYRFSNNNVRMAFTKYCEAEAFALFEDDQRLWRYVMVLGNILNNKKKLTHEQCLEIYNAEYFKGTWVRDVDK